MGGSSRRSLSERFTELDQEYLGDIFIHRKLLSAENKHLLLASQGIPIDIKSFKFGYINIHLSYSPIFQLIIKHNARLLYMRRATTQSNLKREWFDLSNKGDVKHLLGEDV
jgi:hypothetical protein